MRSPFAQRVIAFLLTMGFFWCFYEAVLMESQQRKRAKILAEEKYQELQHYVDENDLDYDKIQTICYGSDPSDDTFRMNFVATVSVCGLTIIPYSVLLWLIRRLADRFPPSNAESGRDQTPEELRQ